MPRRRDRYSPDSQPPCDSALANWLQRELAVIGRLLEQPRLTETFAEPEKPEPFVLLLADGTLWDPGFGRGVYYWDPALSDWYLLG